MLPNEEKQKYPGINGLRAISISFVICYHLALQTAAFNNLIKIEWLRPVLYFIMDGQLGVNVFFVVSGFLITSLLMREEARTQAVSLKDFYIRRALRIFPAYYFLLLVYVVLQLFNLVQISPSSWLTAITFTKYFNWHQDWYTAHAWSLSIEEHFYFFWPLIFTTGIRPRKSVAITLILVVPLIRLLLYYHPVEWMNENTIFMRVDAIAVGCVFALYKDVVKQRLGAWLGLLFYVSVSGLFLMGFLPGLVDKLHSGFLSLMIIALGLTHGTVGDFLVGFIIMYAIYGPPGLWNRLLNLRVLDYIGVLSYSIYLWQQLFLSGGTAWFTQFPQNLFLIAVTAMFSYHFIEKPFLRLKSRFTVSKPALPADGALPQ